MTVRPLPSIDRLRELFSYNAETGEFVRIAGKKSEIGKRTGTLGYGYWLLCADGHQYAAHRIAWFMHYGVEPDGPIDHINCVRDDNRICNLRLASIAQNNANKAANKNNTHGFKGVTRVNKRWQAQIKNGYRNVYLGTFDTPEDAHAAYLTKARELFGEFARGDHD